MSNDMFTITEIKLEYRNKQIPEEIVKEMAETKKEDRKKKAIEISARIINRIKPMCQGVHLMPLGWDDVVPEIIHRCS